MVTIPEAPDPNHIIFYRKSYQKLKKQYSDELDV